MHILYLASLFAVVASAHPPLLGSRQAASAQVPRLQGAVEGVATWNNFGKETKPRPDGTCGPRVGNQPAQCGVNCGEQARQAFLQQKPPGVYMAAAGDLGNELKGVTCPATAYKCVGGKAKQPDGTTDYAPPHCTQANCGKCYKVTNKGALDGKTEVSGVNKSIEVRIVDACPSNSAQNICKADDPKDPIADEKGRCAASDTNALDIDLDAYRALTDMSADSGPVNLSITIEECS